MSVLNFRRKVDEILSDQVELNTYVNVKGEFIDIGPLETPRSKFHCIQV